MVEMSAGVVAGFALVAVFVVFVGYRIYKSKTRKPSPGNSGPGGGGSRPGDPPTHPR